MTRTLGIAVMALALVAGGRAAPPEITASTALAVGSWVTAVRSHTSGRRDDALAHVSALSLAARQTLNPGMHLFLSALQKRVVSTNDAERRIVEMARDVRLSPGPDAFLRRAAVLHSDAAMVAEPPPVAPVRPPATASQGVTSPLLSGRRLFLGKDGEIVGELAANWNWPFARSLLDLLTQGPAGDPFAGTWYHATTAYLFGQRSFGEAFAHLERAAAVLPDDARLLFDRACYSEFQGMPVSQVLLSDEDVNALRAQRFGQRAPRLIAGRAGELGIPPADVANGLAERLFRRALEADPSLVEARVRLARLLDLRQRHAEAAAELNTALAAKPVGAVAYFAHLFAGRTAQALGQVDDAVRHYREAAALFPGAQSALLGQSQAALLGSDVTATLAPIQRLDKSSSARDPWWQYHLAAGRDADALLREMWGQVPKL